MTVLYTSLIINSFEYENLVRTDLVFILLIFLTLNFYAILFAFINRNIEDLLII